MDPQQMHQARRRWAARSFGTLGLGLLLTACRPQGPVVDLAAEERAVKRASLDFSNAERSGKPDSALTFMWEDAVLQPPGHAQIQGHDAIREFYAPVKLGTPPTDSAPPRPDFPVHVSAGGDLAVEWGPGTILVHSSDGQRIVHFKFVTVWERRGGVWKVRLNSWNGDPPSKSE